MRPRTAYMTRVHEVLADAQPHNLDELVEQAGPLIPEGQAWRTAEASRRRLTSRTGQPAPAARTQGDRTTAIAAGRRQILIKNIWNDVHRGAITRNPDGTYQQRSDP